MPGSGRRRRGSRRILAEAALAIPEDVSSVEPVLEEVTDGQSQNGTQFTHCVSSRNKPEGGFRSPEDQGREYAHHGIASEKPAMGPQTCSCVVEDPPLIQHVLDEKPCQRPGAQGQKKTRIATIDREHDPLRAKVCCRREDCEQGVSDYERGASQV